MELTTVAEDEAVAHEEGRIHRWTSLAPGRAYRMGDLAFRTLPARGERLATFVTVNDLHFGEEVCGLIEGADVGPVFRSEPGEPPYPETMNGAAVEEIAALTPDAVVAKGDLTAEGTEAQYADFLRFWGEAFGERLVHVRGNHDAYHAERFVPEAPREVELPGVRLAVLDTAWPGHAGGRLRARDLEWLDELAARSDRPVLVLGHHPVWDRGAPPPAGEVFSLQPGDSERLVEVVARRPRIRGYFAGHTHRCRVQRFAATGEVPFAEVASVKDFPGVWAEYRVYEGGILQIVRRIGRADALRWSERTRAMFSGHYARYALGALEERCFEIPARPQRG